MAPNGAKMDVWLQDMTAEMQQSIEKHLMKVFRADQIATDGDTGRGTKQIDTRDGKVEGRRPSHGMRPVTRA